MRLKKIYLPIILAAIILNSSNLFAQQGTQIKDVDELKKKTKYLLKVILMFLKELKLIR